MDGLDCAKCQKSRKKGHGINGKFNENKTRMNGFLLQIEEENVQGLEQIGSSLDF